MQIYEIISNNFDTSSRLYHNRIINSELLLNHPYLFYVWGVMSTHKLKEWNKFKHINEPDESDIYNMVKFEAIPSLFNIDRRVLKKQLDELENMKLVYCIRNKHKATTVILNPYYCNCFTMNQKLVVLEYLNPEQYKNEYKMNSNY